MPSNGVNVRTILDTSGFDAAMKYVPANVTRATEAVAQAIIDDVNDHWSGFYPPASAPGTPPAIRSSSLKDSARKRLVKSGLLNEYRVIWEAFHAMFLEKGTRRMSERPYLQPAIVRARTWFKSKYEMVFRR
jgi:hypothetical protein